MPNALPIFVSHSHEDSAFCQALVTALRESGADVWYDEHNMGAGHLMDVIQQELDRRKIFIVILSRNAFGSKWVKRETTWAYELFDRDPTRVILPVTAGTIERNDFSGANGWLFLGDFKRIEAPGYQPYPQAEAIGRTLHALSLTPAGQAPTPVAPQPAESADDLITRGKALRGQGKHAEALALFEGAAQLEPGSYNAWFNVAYSLDALGRYEEAVAAYDRAISLNRNDPVTWYNKGHALESGLSRSQEALSAFEQALALNPKYVEVWHWKGTALWSLQRYEESLAAYEQALALDPNLALIWNGKGTALYYLRRFDEALAAFEQAATLDPTLGFVWANKASTLRNLGRTKEAEEAEARAAALGG